MPDTPTGLEITYRRCFGTKEGIDVLEDLVERGGVFATAPPDKGTENMWLMQGSRNIVLYILGMAGKTKLEDMEVLCRNTK